MTTTPRIATSLDDLRVGQLVVIYEPSNGKGWVTPIIHYPGTWAGYLSPENEYAVVILSDPPPAPVTVDREAFDRLAEKVAYCEANLYGDADAQAHLLLAAARALVESVREGEA